MIIDCPNPSYVQDIVSSDSLDFYKHFPEARLNFILHKTGPGVLEDARYAEWMESFDDNTEVDIYLPSAESVLLTTVKPAFD